MHRRFFNGFTLVELVIVVAVIGILATVAVVSYRGTQNSARDTAVQTDLSKIADEMNLYFTDNNKYPSASSQLQSKGVKGTRNSYGNAASTSQLIYCFSSGGTDMALVGRSRSGKIFSITDEEPVKLAASQATPLACPSNTPAFTSTVYTIHTINSSSAAVWNYGF